MNYIQNRCFLLYAVLLFSFLSCNKSDSDLPVDKPFEFLQPGDNTILEYGIKTTDYTNTGKVVSYSYERQEFEVMEYNSAGFGVNFKVIHYQSTDKLLWTKYDLSLITINDSLVLTTRNNIITKLVRRPVLENNTWNGNTYNSKPKEEYKSVNVNQGFEKGDSLNYKNTVTIDRGQLETFISCEENYTVLAEEIGIVYQFDKNIGFQPGEDTTGTITEKWLLR